MQMQQEYLRQMAEEQQRQQIYQQGNYGNPNYYQVSYGNQQFN